MTANNPHTPESQAAEEALIGALHLDPRAFANVAHFLKSEHFYWLPTRYLYAAFERMFESKNYALDNPVLVADAVRADANSPLNDPGAVRSYLFQLARNCPTSAHIEMYAHLVYRAWKRREIIRAADTLHVLARDEELSIEEVFTRAESELFAVTETNASRAPSDMASVMEAALDNLDARIDLVQSGQGVGIPTGYQALDDLIGGGYRKELTIWGAPAGFGKSTIILNIARNRCRMGVHLVIFSTEMTRDDIAVKFLSMETGIPVTRLKGGKIEGGDYSRVLKAGPRIASWPIWIVDDYRHLTPLDAQRELRRLTHESHIDSVLIDGLWQMQHHKSEKLYRGNRPAEVTAIMENLVDLARDFNVSLDVVHQLKRAASERGDKRPILQDLGESAGTERTAHVVVGLYRESYYERGSGDNSVEAILLKNRLGTEYGVATLEFEKDSETYRDQRHYIPKEQRIIINTGSHRVQ